MNVSANSLSDTSGDSDDTATEAARRMNWTNTRAPRNQPSSSNPGTPGPVATTRSISSGFKPAMPGGFKRRMLNKRETTAVASANAAMAGKEPRSCQIADINNRAIQTVVDAANHAVTGWVRMTLKPHPIMTIATAKVTRLSQRAELSILIASVPMLYFEWRELMISSFREKTSCDLLLAVHMSTLATPISCSSVRLSSMCQLSVMRPFSILTRSVAMKGTGWPLPCVCPNLPVKWPLKFICTVT